ncbi:MAG: hypothetical protein WC761_00765 [Candidatus Paceibacterota bacterium]|jgi:hypothetical protein
MLIKDYQKYLNLSRVLNSTFGTDGADNKAFNTQSVKFDILDDGMLKCRYMMIVNFGSDTMMREMMRRYRTEAMGMLEAALDRIKEEYRTQFPGLDVPKFSIMEETIGEEVEFLTFGPYKGTRKAYYRFGCLIEIT